MLKLFTIILATVLCRGSLSPKEHVLTVGQQELLFAPILATTNEAVIIKEINKNFQAGLGVETIGGASLAKTILNIFNFNPSSLLLAYRNMDLSNLEEELFRFLVNYSPASISAAGVSSKEDLNNSKDNGFRVNLEDFLVCIIRKDLQTNKDQNPDGRYLSAEVVQRVTGRLEQQWRSRKQVDEEAVYNAVTVIQSRISKSMNFKIKFSNSLKRFAADRFGTLQAFILSFVEGLAIDPSKNFPDYKKIILTLIGMFGTFKEIDSLLIIGKYMSDGFWSDRYVSPDFFRKTGFYVVRVLSSLALMINPDEDRRLLNDARDLFFRFYRPSVYPKLSVEVKWLMMALVRGLSSSLQPEISSSGKALHLTPTAVLAIDFLLASREMPSDFLPLIFYKLILQNIESLASEFSQKDLKILAGTKYIFLKTSSLIPNHYELYTDLYEASVAMVAHWGVVAAKRKTASNDGKPDETKLQAVDKEGTMAYKGLTFWTKWDRFINLAHLASLDSNDFGGCIFTNTPWKDNRFFPTSVRQNYFFYHAAMLLAGLGDQVPIRFVFQKFGDFDNYLIHRYMNEPQVKALFKPLQHMVRPKRGYNYQVFSDVEIHGSVFSKIQERNLKKREFLEMHKLNEY